MATKSSRQIVAIGFIAITLPLVGSPRTALRRHLEELRRQGGEAFRAHSLMDARAVFETGYQLAWARQDAQYAFMFKANLAGVDFVGLHYQKALDEYLEARKLSEGCGERDDRALIDLNLASLSILLGDLDLAGHAVERALLIVSTSDPRNLRYQLLACRALIRSKQGDLRTATADFEKVIAEARRRNDSGTAARYLEFFGDQLLAGRNFAAAELAFDQALQLRRSSNDGGLRLLLLRLSWLRLEEGKLTEAREFLRQARGTTGNDLGIHEWFILYLQARLLYKEGAAKESLGVFQSAIQAGRDWQTDVAPAGIPGSDARRLLKDLYREMVDASLSVEPNLALAGFEATEEDRAAALRQTLIGSTAFLKDAPPEYWTSLARLRTAQSEDYAKPSPQTRKNAEELLWKVSELEVRAGHPILSTINTTFRENNTSGTTLRHIQKGLLGEEALLSFHVGSRSSALWAVTKERIQLYRLPAESRLTGQIAAFRLALKNSETGTDGMAAALYEELFGALGPEFREKPVWVVTAEDSFFEIPLGALVVGRKEGKPVYLTEKHAVLHTPSAAMWTEVPQPVAEGPFLGVGNGVFNGADERWKPILSRSNWLVPLPLRPPNSIPLELVRLPGSGKEIASCASIWGNRPPAIQLTGTQASRAELLPALELHPSIIHFATHFLTPPDRPGEPLIDLGLTPRGEADVLNEKDIISLRVPGAVVAMSGCNSGGSSAIPTSGVLGLSRAWLIAGATAVVGSRWPTPDDTGVMFSAFYRHLRERKQEPSRLRASARALQESQIDMIRSRSWRSNPQYWSAFYVVGKE